MQAAAPPTSSPRVTAAACCALGLSPDRLPACPVTAGAGRLLLSLSVVRTRLRTVDRLILLLPHRSQLLPRGPRFPLSVSLRLPRLGQLPFGLPGRCEARLPPIGLGLLGASPKLRPGLFGRRDLRLQPGLVRVRRLAGLRHLLLRRPAHPFQLRPGLLSRLPRLKRIGLGLLGMGLKPRPGLLSCPARPVQLRLSRLGPGGPGLRACYRLVPLLPDRSQLLPRGLRLLLSGGLRLPRLPRISPGPRGAGLKPRPGSLSRRDLLVRRPARLVQLRLSRLGPGRPGLGPGRPGLGPGRRVSPRPPGLRAAARDSALATASSRSCRTAASCSRAARASCSAAACASRASRASASARAARA